ncbi:MAG: NAD(P)/FAD-dependent oxidoreductase [Pseudomonadota bacterium]|nr:NAD(P)/FAD-dependent oxidoreductase [Pseudomonadota bacterium]
MGLRLLAAGRRDFLILEQAQRPGGTWRDNRYPGAACDVESLLYSYSFQPKPDWARDFASQTEILAYLDDCTARAGLNAHLRCGAEVVEACYVAASAGWRIALADGSTLRCRDLIVATGALSRPSWPDIPGRESFAGEILHSARWRVDCDPRGRRVAVIGTGASAIQLVPTLARQAAQLTVFQRTPPWILPRRNRPIPRWRHALHRSLPWLQSLRRSAIYWQRELHALAMVRQPGWMALARHAALRHLHAQIADPMLRARLEPDYAIGCKRILLSDDYLPALTRPQVRLVSTAITGIEAQGVRTRDGVLHACDTLVFATGFVTANRAVPLQASGRDGIALAERWMRRPQAYLGTAMRDFPNLFLLVGPNTGLGHSSMIYMIEAQIALVLRCLAERERRSARTIEVHAAAEQAFNTGLEQRLRRTVWASGCRSWYLNDDGSNSTLWPDFTFRFRARTRDFRSGDWIFGS